MPVPRPVIVSYAGADAGVRFAAAELRKYLSRMSGRSITLQATTEPPESTGIWLGTAARLGSARPRRKALAQTDSDAIYLKAAGSQVIISGANPRSVLFATYHYLEALGCRWLHPGKDGERVPALGKLPRLELDLFEVPSAAHRCVCIEGSCSQQHATDLVDFAAKLGCNGYLVQFRNAYTFFNRWYSREAPPRQRRADFDSDRAQSVADAVKREVVRRGLMLHTVGHGWTCEPFGIPGEEWMPSNLPVPKAAARFFASVGGKRELSNGIALNTQLCYGNPAARKIMVEAVADYAAAHPAEDVIHVWLADGSNNHCECSVCSEQRPSDWYVMLLNEIDLALTSRQLAARIVFGVYVDTLWAPVRQRLHNADRFILMFAPITRTFSRSLPRRVPPAPPRLPPFRRNRLKFSGDPGENLQLLAGWQRAFSGEIIQFDYHLWRAHHHDPGQLGLASVLHRDLATIGGRGMRGWVSCQAQRVAFPTGVYLQVLGRTLWQHRRSFDSIVDSHLADLFDDQGPTVRAYLESVSRLAGHELFGSIGNDGKATAPPGAIDGWQAVQSLVDSFMPVITAGCKSTDPVSRAAWRRLADHAWYVKAYAELHRRIFERDVGATELYSNFRRELDKRLGRLHPVFDSYIAKVMTQHALAMQNLPFEDAIVD